MLFPANTSAKSRRNALKKRRGPETLGPSRFLIGVSAGPYSQGGSRIADPLPCGLELEPLVQRLELELDLLVTFDALAFGVVLLIELIALVDPARTAL